MRAVRLALFNVVSVLSCASFLVGTTLAHQHDAQSNATAVRKAFARLAQEKSYRVESKGSASGVKIDSRIDVQFPDRFHILNRGPNPSELILTPEGSFAKTAANSPWRAVPMSYQSIADSMGAKANEVLLKSMQNVVFKGAAKCSRPAGKAQQYQFQTDSGNSGKASMRTTITIASQSGLPCRIRAQQSDADIDTTASYDYTSKFSIRAPL